MDHLRSCTSGIGYVFLVAARAVGHLDTGNDVGWHGGLLGEMALRLRNTDCCGGARCQTTRTLALSVDRAAWRWGQHLRGRGPAT
jgi:hypothetical protein